MRKNNQDSIDLSLILPLYNEGPVLEESLARVFQVLEKSGLSHEIILIDDKSVDQTISLAEKSIQSRKNCFLYKHAENVGRGGTVSEGFKKAGGKVVGFIDVDLEAGPEYIPDFARGIINQEAEGIVGLRKYKVTFATLLRFFSSRFYQFLVRRLLGLPFQDTESGYKFFLREKILPVLAKTENKDWFWDTEIMARAYAEGLKILEKPVAFCKNPKKKSTVSLWGDSLKYLKALWHFKFRKK